MNSAPSLSYGESSAAYGGETGDVLNTFNGSDIVFEPKDNTVKLVLISGSFILSGVFLWMKMKKK